MPRRTEIDPEDRMARCPRCKGSERVYDIAQEAEVECPVCFGAGRVTQAIYQTYLRTGDA